MRILNILIILLLFIFVESSLGQSKLSLKINNPVYKIKKNVELLKVDLQILKNDTINEYNLFGFGELVESYLMLYLNNDTVLCGNNEVGLRFIIFKDSIECLGPKVVLDGNTKITLLDSEKYELKHVDIEYIINNNLQDFYYSPQCFISSNLKINKTDNKVNKTVYLNLEDFEFKKGTYFLCFVYHLGQYNIEKIKFLDTKYIKYPFMMHTYNDCIISNKVKFIVE
jgi:hypothetical protein